MRRVCVLHVVCRITASEYVSVHPHTCGILTHFPYYITFVLNIKPPFNLHYNTIHSEQYIIIVWHVLFSHVEPVGQMSRGSKSLIVMFVRYLKTQWDMVLFSMFRHHCCSQNILDKRNRQHFRGSEMPGSCCLASLVILFPRTMHVNVHVPATVSVYMFAYMLMRKGVVLSPACVYVCTHAIVIKPHSKWASHCPHNEHLETDCNVKEKQRHTHTDTSLVFTSTHLSPGI